MFNWLKEFFKSDPSNRMVPISQQEADIARQEREKDEEVAFNDLVDDILKEQEMLDSEVETMEREWVYIGDGMMEEVVMTPAQKRLQRIQLTGTTSTNTSNASRSISYTEPTYMPVYAGSDYADSGYSSCDSGSPGGSCD